MYMHIKTGRYPTHPENGNNDEKTWSNMTKRWNGWVAYSFTIRLSKKNTLGITKEGPTDHADKPGTQS